MLVESDTWCPTPLLVRRIVRETTDVFSFTLADPLGVLRSFRPGQFNMLYAFGVGEVPISVSSVSPRRTSVVHTIREVGPATRALGKVKAGDLVGVRGPFGTPWPMTECADRDVVVVAGGIGLAPLRPVIHAILRQRTRYGRVSLVYGARRPEDLLFRRELERWSERRDLQLEVTVDRAGPDWTGSTGVVTRLLGRMYCRPDRSIALLCGPEVMLRFAARELVNLGYGPDSLFVSAERNMKCGIGLCGRCQLGPHFVCKDGPVFRYDAVNQLLGVREL